MSEHEPQALPVEFIYEMKARVSALETQSKDQNRAFTDLAAMISRKLDDVVTALGDSIRIQSVANERETGCRANIIAPMNISIVNLSGRLKTLEDQVADTMSFKKSIRAWIPVVLSVITACIVGTGAVVIRNMEYINRLRGTH